MLNISKNVESHSKIFKVSNQQSACFDVIIIGGGCAGLGAARELQSKGVDSFIILEASDRIGGRVKTTKSDSGITLDLGAQWLHGEHGNSIFFLSQGRKLLQEKLSLDGAGDFCTENGKRIPSTIVDETLNAMSDISEECKLFFELSTKKSLDDKNNNEHNYNPGGSLNLSPFDYTVEGLSVGEFYYIRFKEYLKMCKDNSDSEIRLKKSLFNWVLRWELIDNACNTLFDISAKRWGEYIFCSGRNNMNPIDGMISLITNASEGIPQSKIMFKKHVVEIDYDLNSQYMGTRLIRSSGESAIIIKCSDGSKFYCDHVIITVSLGVLKSSCMFSPSLPYNIQKAINSIGFGTLDKIFLEFPYEWWKEDFVGLQFIWTDEKLMSEKDSRKDSIWYRGITGFDAIPGKKNILCGWIGGKEAIEMERLDPQDVEDRCLSLLKIFSGNPDVPKPIAMYRSSWYFDPLFLGSYSHRLTSTEEVSSQELNMPIYSNCEKIPLIVFAGEANSLNFFSTVHGAFDNGVVQSHHYTDHRSKRFLQSERLKSKL